MNESSKQKHGRLLTSLISKTAAKSIEWIELASGERVSANVGRFRIILEPARGRNGGAAERVKIVDDDGATIDQFIDEDLDEASVPLAMIDGVFPLMVQLRKDAIRSALGADDALDELLSNLNGLTSND